MLIKNTFNFSIVLLAAQINQKNRKQLPGIKLPCMLLPTQETPGFCFC